jgi:SAM-dependent methyltransferase
VQGPGALAEDEASVFADFASRVALEGAVVVEVGGAYPTEQLLATGVQKWYSIDPARSARRSPDGRHEVIAARAEEMPLPDACADAVFSCNAFEFVDVAATLAEARRILKPGGLLYAHFGPIWSAIDGHQLEYVTYEGRDLVFWKDTYLPPWAHLAYERDELRALLLSALPADLVDILVTHVHDSDTVNRLLLEDYVECALASGLQWVQVAASSHLDYDIQTPDYDPSLLRDVDPQELAEELSRRLGRRVQLGARDVLMVLAQPR